MTHLEQYVGMLDQQGIQYSRFEPKTTDVHILGLQAILPPYVTITGGGVYHLFDAATGELLALGAA